jgi:hypothetical protein
MNLEKSFNLENPESKVYETQRKESQTGKRNSFCNGAQTSPLRRAHASAVGVEIGSLHSMSRPSLHEYLIPLPCVPLELRLAIVARRFETP